MTKEELLDKYSVGVSAGEYAIECDKAHVAMDEYAEQQCIAFLNWTNDNVSDMYFDDGEWYYKLKYSGEVVDSEKLYTQFLNTL